MPLPMTVERSKRVKRNVPRTAQIGKVQAAILDWLLTREQEIKASGVEQEKVMLEARGVPWDVKALCRTYAVLCKPDGSPDKSKVSTSLKQLEVGRSLVKRYGKRTQWVMLTAVGRGVAEGRRKDPRPWWERREEEKARYLAGNISYELARYSDQMSEVNYYIETARLAFHLLILRDLGRISEHEGKELTRAIEVLQAGRFKELLPNIKLVTTVKDFDRLSETHIAALLLGIT